ncbi:hypothetical protein [Acidipila sp. EB88]|uniref:hypothetical protein n=1 Tax=Acidipila sp. EB88 TaxID=2305226 RepID=UPI000F5E6DAE|nr:hypothetical protein [Acidipila sp. EB88]
MSTEGDLQDCTARFAKEHGVALPVVLDPQRKLMDRWMRQPAGVGAEVHEPPIVFVVTAGVRAGVWVCAGA